MLLAFRTRENLFTRCLQNRFTSATSSATISSKLACSAICFGVKAENCLILQLQCSLYQVLHISPEIESWIAWISFISLMSGGYIPRLFLSSSHFVAIYLLLWQWCRCQVKLNAKRRQTRCPFLSSAEALSCPSIHPLECYSYLSISRRIHRIRPWLPWSQWARAVMAAARATGRHFGVLEAESRPGNQPQYYSLQVQTLQWGRLKFATVVLYSRIEAMLAQKQNPL